MNNSILQKILINKQEWINTERKKTPLKFLQQSVKLSTRNFYHALKKKHTVFILECKKASPSQGVICNNFNIIKIANIYKKYADAISVITDERYFHGNFDFLRKVSETVTQPVLCKDFIISQWQIYFARFHQANAILLILSILDDNTYKKLTIIANNLNMGILTEVTNEIEWKRAINLGAKIIGINNRNLHDLTIDLQRTIQLTKKKPKEIIIISESGINYHREIRELCQYVNGFLIGSALTRKKNIDMAVKKILLGENKICGLTRIEDTQTSYKAGAIYGGLIFVPESPRMIDLKKAHQIICDTNNLLYYIGVFRDAPIDYIIHIVTLLNLFAIQLHGQENSDYIARLYDKLEKKCFIWKGLNATQYLIKNKNINKNLKTTKIKRYILDNGQGGTGKTFNWSLLENVKIKKNNIILSGGLGINNCLNAAKLGFAGLDFNSGVETNTPGIKNKNKINKVFQILRNY